MKLAFVPIEEDTSKSSIDFRWGEMGGSFFSIDDKDQTPAKQSV